MCKCVIYVCQDHIFYRCLYPLLLPYNIIISLIASKTDYLQALGCGLKPHAATPTHKLWEQIHIMIVSAVFQVDSHAMSHSIVTYSFELCEVYKS